MPKLKDEQTPEAALIELPISEVPPQTWGLHINTHLSPTNHLHFVAWPPLSTSS